LKAPDRGYVLLAACVGGAVIATNLIDFGLDGSRLGLLNANLSSSWSHRVTAAALATGGALAALRARTGSRQRTWWALTATALVLLFVVEVSPAHVQVDRLSWGKLIYLPLLVGLAASVGHLAKRFGENRLMWIALGALAASYAVHIFGPQVVERFGWGTDSWAYQVKVGLKEGSELAGWLLLVIALWRMGQRSPLTEQRKLRTGDGGT